MLRQHLLGDSTLRHRDLLGFGVDHVTLSDRVGLLPFLMMASNVRFTLRERRL